jgi:hypothetical protein
MNGAREFSGLGLDGTHGRLHIVTGSHARGKTLHIYVLAKGYDVLNNKPSLAGSVEVYGIISGQPGWTECYGWKEQGKWIEDFNEIVKQAKIKKEESEALSEASKKTKADDDRVRIQKALSDY